MNRLNSRNLFNQFSNEVLSAMAQREGKLSTRTQEATPAQWTPSMDVCEDEQKFIIYADLPGVQSDQINIQTENGILSISGERSLPTTGDKGAYRRQERFQGHFERKFTLPRSADTDHIEAQFTHGVLQVSIPKAEKPKARKITIQG